MTRILPRITWPHIPPRPQARCALEHTLREGCCWGGRCPAPHRKLMGLRLHCKPQGSPKDRPARRWCALHTRPGCMSLLSLHAGSAGYLLRQRRRARRPSARSHRTPTGLPRRRGTRPRRTTWPPRRSTAQSSCGTCARSCRCTRSPRTPTRRSPCPGPGRRAWPAAAPTARCECLPCRCQGREALARMHAGLQVAPCDARARAAAHLGRDK